MKHDNETYVFVYGTLKRGFGNHRVMQEAGGVYVGDATMHNMKMIGMGGIPCIDFGDGYEVKGEVYKVSNNKIHVIDILEGFSEHRTIKNNMYIRLKKDVVMEDNSIKKCYFYMINDYDGYVIEDGIFKQGV